MKQPQTVTPEDLLGPLNEFELKAAPPKLFLRGDASLLEGGPRIAVVGSRRASSEGLELARRITEMLVSHGVTVVSGLALGIDAVAHETAMTNGGRTRWVSWARRSIGTRCCETGASKTRSGSDICWCRSFPAVNPRTGRTSPCATRPWLFCRMPR